MEGDGVDGQPVACEGLFGGRLGQPCQGVDLAVGGERRGRVDLVLEGLALAFQVHDLLLQAHDRGPLLLQQRLVLLGRGMVEAVVVGQVRFLA